ncbi:MAG TPA: NAD(P)H-dependent oxidoreductase subunit E [Candidatus Methylomirabilis sp.]
MVLEELRAIQERHGYIPEDALREIARARDIPPDHLHALAASYPYFRLAPPKRLEVQVCRDLSCHLRGAADLAEAARRAAREACGADWRVEGVSCLGRCDGAPALAVNGRILSHRDRARLLDAVRRGAAGPLPEAPLRAARHPEALIDPYPGEAERYGALRALRVSGGHEMILAELHASGLREIGEAGFPAGSNWETVRGAPEEGKAVVCNGGESGPGTFKDRYLMQAYPHLVWEGMLVAAAVVGARRAVLAIRHEYGGCREALEAEREVIQELSLLEQSPCDLELFVSPGGHLCGEETALLEALEGKRAEPRATPPFPATHGLHGRPTLIHSVETFAFVPVILALGGAWFAGQGVNGAKGLKYLTLFGDVERPGVYEVSLGITAREFIERYGGGVSGGRALKAFMPGGAGGGFLPAALADLPLDFAPLAEAGSRLGAGAVVAIAEGRDMLDLALNVTRFFRDASCGKCAPCRAGSEQIVRILEAAPGDAAGGQQVPPIAELAATMLGTSICRLGRAAPLAIITLLKHFAAELPAPLRPTALA